MEAWKEKAHRLISIACEQSRKQARGKRKKHVPYSPPEIASNLLDCLNNDDEEKAKAIFLSYDGMKLI